MKLLQNFGHDIFFSTLVEKLRHILIFQIILDWGFEIMELDLRFGDFRWSAPMNPGGLFFF
ncbi:MAG TPA: hypothetical protein DCS91_23530 [Microcoleaceae bacterium UBA11344]|nr:hypothetical protein [Microcoleaceae cyanobacterium UBA11344]